MMHTFGTDINGGLVFERPTTADGTHDTAAPARPPAGTVIMARNANDSTPLTPATFTTDAGGRWSYSVDSEDTILQIQVSEDGGVTWSGPLTSAESLSAALTSGDNASSAVSIATAAQITANDAMSLSQSTGARSINGKTPDANGAVTLAPADIGALPVNGPLAASRVAGLAVVATSGNFTDLSNRPPVAIPLDQKGAANGVAALNPAGQVLDGSGAVVSGAATDAASLRLGLAAPHAPLTSTVLGASSPVPIDVFGGYLWGQISNAQGTDIYRSADNGDTWTVYCPAPVGDTVLRLIPCADGEVISVNTGAVRKSTGWAGGNPTWTVKVAANGLAVFEPFNVDGDGTKFIAAQYGPSSTAGSQAYIDSRYGHISTDGGNTWIQVWDSVARFGSTAANNSHLHGACYDPWSDRFYINEGHGSTIAGVYVSDDDGTTWTRPAGLVVEPPPTVMVPTDDGIVCGSDHSQAGVWGIVRRSNLADEAIIRTWAWNVGVDNLIGYGTRGFRDPDTGVVYIGFRSSLTNVAPIIAGGTASSAGLTWTWPTLPVTLSDSILNLAVSGGRLLAYAGINGAKYDVRGELPGPTSSDAVDTGNVRGGVAGGTSVAVGTGATVTALQVHNVVVGVNATATMGDGVAVGYAASATNQAVSVGSGATSNGEAQAVAIGQAATSRSQSVAVGTGATIAASSTTSVAVGMNSQSNQTSGVALGTSAIVNGFEGTALGRSAVVATGHSGSVALGKGVTTSAGNQVAMGGRHIEVVEMTAPGAPAANGARLYVKDNGSGKTQLCVKFSDGIEIVLATQA